MEPGFQHTHRLVYQLYSIVTVTNLAHVEDWKKNENRFQVQVGL
jgi:hypothetical protein